MEERMRGALQAIKGVRIPDLPKEILELDQELNGKFPNTQTIATIIESNTKLSGEVIRIANSPAMKLKTSVSSIRDAVDALGFDNLKNLVIAAAVKNLFNTPQVQEIIEHSTDVAFCCAELSDFVEGVTRDEAYLIGLFHNGGSLLLATKDPDNYLKLFAQANTNPVSITQKEMARYSTTHTDIGVLLGQKWKLPVEMLNTIMLHHLPDNNIGRPKLRAMLAIVKIANCIVNEVSYGAYVSGEGKDYLHSAAEELMVSMDDINQIRRVLVSYNAA